jgi:hypothetical protein
MDSSWQPTEVFCGDVLDVGPPLLSSGPHECGPCTRLSA